MLSNIFANTGTNVSILFLSKGFNNEVILIDASKLGTKIKDGKSQKTVLDVNEIKKIISTFNERVSEEEFSILVSADDLKKKNYSFSAGQFFKVNQEIVEITEQEFLEKVKIFQSEINDLFKCSNELQKQINLSLGGIYSE